MISFLMKHENHEKGDLDQIKKWILKKFKKSTSKPEIVSFYDGP